jgi:hypothetical protein
MATLCTVMLSTPAGDLGQAVTFSNSNGTILNMPSTVTVPAGKTSFTFTVVSRRVSRQLQTTVTATVNGSSHASSIVTVNP